jgi:uncharacterized protein (TIGR03790 family)
LLVAAVGCGSPRPLPALVEAGDPEARRVLVVVNESSPESKEVADYYISKRRVPAGNRVSINVSMSEQISFDEYKYGIEAEVRRAIRRKQNRIDFIVLTKGIPIRLRDESGYSVDATLAGMNLSTKPIERLDEASIRAATSPYFRSNEPFDSAKFGMYLVTRLDGYTVEDAKRLVDNSIAAKAVKGPFFFDAAANRKEGAFLVNQQQLYRANELLKAKGFESTLDTTADFKSPESPLIGYASWGSNDGGFSLETYRKLKFLPGAVAETFVSTSGRTFRRVEGGQSLIADLIAQGITGVKGYVSEPFTFALAEPDVLFDRYTSGFNLAESFYMASRVVKWKDVVIGDPLCAPFAKPKTDNDSNAGKSER